MTFRSNHAIAAAIALHLAGCGAEPPAPAVPAPSATPKAEAPAPAAPPGPTVEDARAFLARVDADLRKLWIARDRAGWVNQNFITDDTEALSAAGEEATAEYVTRAIGESRRFAGLTLPADLARQMKLLQLSQVVPAPTDAGKRAELAQVQASMTSAYGKGEYCPPKRDRAKGSAFVEGKCMKLDALSRVLRTSKLESDLREAWEGWHKISPPIAPKYETYVKLGNEGAKEIGFDDLGALWRAGYDMSPAELEADVDRLWSEVKPLYDDLHCFVRGKLQEKYGKQIVPDGAPVPAHLFGNMWAQEWNNIYDLVEPYPKAASLDVDKRLREQKWSAEKMVKLGEKFFTSLGFDPLPKTFWERSLLTRPKDREVVCHASAWDVTWSNDLRIKMCIEPTEEDLVTIHHELGHDFYFHEYYKLPSLFQQGANDGFHEGIGDTLALSVTPAYLKSLGLLDELPKDDKALIDVQMKMALDKVAFLPFGLIVDKWRWDVFSGKTPRDRWNASWWDLRKKYQGVSPPLARSEQDFDPGAKYHVPGSTPYLRYFLARIYQFQFHRALCKAAGNTGPLEQCSIYGNAAAGAKLKAMLDLGASTPWQDAMEAISGERRADASALLEYFAPLRKWLAEHNRGAKCGW